MLVEAPSSHWHLTRFRGMPRLSSDGSYMSDDRFGRNSKDSLSDSVGPLIFPVQMLHSLIEPSDVLSCHSHISILDSPKYQ